MIFFSAAFVRIYFITATFSLAACTLNNSTRDDGKGSSGEDTVSKVNADLFHTDSIKGDFNGDGKAEYAWLSYFEPIPVTCKNCDPTIWFSDKSLPAIVLDLYASGGNLINQGDINDDGADDLSVVPFGDASEWSTCILYSFRNGAWMEPVGRFPVFGAGGDYVDTDSARKGYLQITEYILTEDKGVMPRTRSIRLE
jgi:hypothetical protein